MKPLFIKIFIANVLLLVAANTFAQQTDYVITTKGDTLQCDISFPLFSSAGKYKVNGSNQSGKLKPDEIKEYYSYRKKTLYRAINKPGTEKPEYALVVEKGKINLYQQVTQYYNYAVNAYSSNTVQWYVGKGTESVVELKTSGLFFDKSRKERKDDFADMIKDNKIVYDKYMADGKFTFKQLRKLVHLYNTSEELED
ncbi:MAG: hypothetical protein ACXVAY_12720 [Mucilaginibacter sp.]